jgi:colanic acid/amylovoran biosynthesis glycosyltransferase
VPSLENLVDAHSGSHSVKIAYIMNSYPMTSTTFIHREIRALEQQGVDVLRIALRTWRGELVDEGDGVEQKRTRYVLREGSIGLLRAIGQVSFSSPSNFIRAFALALKMSWRADRPWYVHLVYLAEACCVLRWLYEDGVQHVHAHFGTNAAEVAMLVRVLGGPEWSFTVHGPEEFDKPQLIHLSEKIRHCSFVVAVSSYTRSQLYRWSKSKYWPKINVVHCGLEEEFYESPPIPVPSARRLVCVGRLCEQKGQLLLIEAARQLINKNVDFRLVLAGDGELRGQVEDLIRRNNLQGIVEITGWIDRQRVRDEILAARALVLPSFAEGLPVVIMEAMALGRPVVSTFVGGIPELVQTSENGWLVPAGDVEALTHAMEVCLDAPIDVLNNMGSAARKRVSYHHRVDIEAGHLVKLFKRVIEAKRKSPNNE